MTLELNRKLIFPYRDGFGRRSARFNTFLQMNGAVKCDSVPELLTSAPFEPLILSRHLQMNIIILMQLACC